MVPLDLHSWCGSTRRQGTFQANLGELGAKIEAGEGRWPIKAFFEVAINVW